MPRQRSGRSGGPSNCSAKFHLDSSGQSTAAGMSSGLPRGAPPPTQRTMVSSCSSVRDRLYLKSWMPTVLSMCQGGICRVDTRSLIDRAQGRDSWKVPSDIGAIEPGRWHASHLAWHTASLPLFRQLLAGLTEVCLERLPEARPAAMQRLRGHDVDPAAPAPAAHGPCRVNGCQRSTYPTTEIFEAWGKSPAAFDRRLW